jgi:predicted nucleotidyltransferase
VEPLGVFGSASRDEATSESDIDIWWPFEDRPPSTGAGPERPKGNWFRGEQILELVGRDKA